MDRYALCFGGVKTYIHTYIHTYIRVLHATFDRAATRKKISDLHVFRRTHTTSSTLVKTARWACEGV